MVWTSPIWLLGLLPWAAATLLLLVARRPRQNIPFLPLWKIDMPREAHRRHFSLPPIAILLGLLAALLAIVAAGEPGLRERGSGLTVVIDTGATMSAKGQTRERYAELMAAVAADIKEQAGSKLPFEILVVPSPTREQVFTGNLQNDLVANLQPTAMQTTDQLLLTARFASNYGKPVLVLSDRPLDLSGARIAQVAPDRGLRDVGIAQFAVRKLPKPQAMVRLTSVGDGTLPKSATLRISSGGKMTDTAVDLPAGGATRDLFVNLPAIGATATVELVGAADDFSGNDRADLVAEADWPAIEPLTPIGELSRLLELYAKNRPPGERSIHVRLVGAQAQLKNGDGILLPPAGTPTSPTRATTVAAHPITAAVSDWKSFDLPAADSRTLPETGWTVLLADEKGPLVAVRELGAEVGADRPIRQVWCAISVGGWANLPQYVVFWSAVMDWVGKVEAGGDRLVVHPLTELSPMWQWVEGAVGSPNAVFWPGVYERSGDAARRAFGPAASLTPTIQHSAAERSTRIAELLRHGEHVTSLSRWLLIGSMVLVLLSVIFWSRRKKGPSAGAV